MPRGDGRVGLGAAQPEQRGAAVFIPDVSAVPAMGGGGPSSQPQAATSGDPDESLDQYAQSRWIAGASPIVAAPGLQPSALGAAAAAGVGARSRLAAGARALGTVASSIASATGLMDSSSDEYSDDDTGSYSQDSLSRAPIGDAGGSMPRNLQQRLETASAASPAAAAGASASASPPLVFAQTFSDIEIAAPDAPAAQGATRPLALRHDNIAVAAQPSASATPHQPTADQPPARPPYQDAPASSLFRLPEAGLDASPSSPDPLSDWDSQEGRPWSQTLSPIRRETQSVSATPRGLLQKPLLKPAMPEPRSAPRSTSIDAELLFMDIVADDVQAPMRPRAPPTPLERVLASPPVHMCMRAWQCRRYFASWVCGRVMNVAYQVCHIHVALPVCHGARMQH